jgi:hypothetical protein
MTNLRLGQRVKIKASARTRNPYATLGTVRAVVFDDIDGAGRATVYEVDATDDQGYRTTEFLDRSKITPIRTPRV